jgi:hypothetical protein
VTTEFRIVDESEVPQRNNGHARWRELAELFDSLPGGKWIEVPVGEDELPGNVGMAIAQSMRVVRKPYGVSYRTIRKSRQLFVTKKVLPAEEK